MSFPFDLCIHKFRHNIYLCCIQSKCAHQTCRHVSVILNCADVWDNVCVRICIYLCGALKNQVDVIDLSLLVIFSFALLFKLNSFFFEIVCVFDFLFAQLLIIVCNINTEHLYWVAILSFFFFTKAKMVSTRMRREPIL